MLRKVRLNVGMNLLLGGAIKEIMVLKWASGENTKTQLKENLDP